MTHRAMRGGQCKELKEVALLRLLDGRVVTVEGAADLAGIPPTEAEQLLETLVDAQLLASTAPGQYRVHELVRVLAREYIVNASAAVS